MLESIDNQNIKRIRIENPETQEEIPVPAYDPIRIFQENDWWALQHEVLTGEEAGYLYPNASLMVMNNERREEAFRVHPGVTEDEVKSKIISEASRGLESLAWACYAFPEMNIISKTPHELIERFAREGNDKLLNCRNQNDWRHFFEYAAWLTVIGQRPQLSNGDVANLETELKSKTNKINNLNIHDIRKLIAPGYVEDIIEEGAAMSIIFPDYALKISPDSAQKMEEFIRAHTRKKKNGGEWFMFSAMAKIVADKCVEVALRKDLEVKEQPLPTQRKF